MTKTASGRKSRDEKPGCHLEERGGGERKAVYIPRGLSGLCSDFMRPSCSFLPLAHVQSTLHFSSGKLELYLLRETHGALAKQVSLAQKERPSQGILVAQAGSTRGALWGVGWSHHTGLPESDMHTSDFS